MPAFDLKNVSDRANIGFGVLLVLATTIVLGWQGRLWWCRRREPEKDESSNYEVSSKTRRILVIALYSLALILVGSVVAAMASKTCLEDGPCTALEDVYLSLFGSGIFLIPLAIVLLGWQGLLWGCRKAKSSNGPAIHAE